MSNFLTEKFQNKVKVQHLELAINVIYTGRDGIERIIASYDKEAKNG